MSGNISKRRRNVLACDVCRGRRTKCDGRRPKCAFCEKHNTDCVYRELPPPSSRIESEIVKIRERLDNIDCLLSARQHASANAPGLSTSETSRIEFQREEEMCETQEAIPDFPYMTIKTPSMMNIIGLDSDLGAWITGVERAAFPTLPRSGGSRVVVFQHENVMSSLAAFSEKIHVWYPILEPSFSDGFARSTADLHFNSSNSCLSLLVVAIGSLAKHHSITTALNERPDAPYIEAALAFLPTVMIESSVRALQCLILFSVYYLCLLKPYQAHDYILTASLKAQNLLRSGSLEPQQLEFARRSFWSILLIETELAVQLDLVDSGIWKHENDISLPSGDETWNYGLSSPSNGYANSPKSAVSSESISDEVLSYLLAEIAMRRMLQRCTVSISNTINGKLVYAPIIAAELELQLEQWYEYLPAPLRWNRFNAIDNSSTSTCKFLRTQYYAYKTSIFWPAVYQAIESGVSDDDLLEYCQKFFTSYTYFTESAVSVLPHCMPNAWTLHTSIFIMTMAALKAVNTPCLFSHVSPEVLESIDIAADAFGDVKLFSPSLAAMQEFLHQAVARGRRY
ncbi:hypothetical protein AJ78_07452 [Emergomyces pasteurianus Ep9510]|uniref:Zn(2)-C6 fungal-type domain-containing protein n=1 Tax=Emergomyces pasteurianus Ep9510 TaxID=1447872 RepID=A0A1J9P582_9EURO|nr:hypothetical protein AJ78_07452 [Emergomyces pasteurianus Ep9510]